MPSGSLTYSQRSSFTFRSVPRSVPAIKTHALIIKPTAFVLVCIAGGLPLFSRFGKRLRSDPLLVVVFERQCRVEEENENKEEETEGKVIGVPSARIGVQ